MEKKGNQMSLTLLHLYLMVYQRNSKYYIYVLLIYVTIIYLLNHNTDHRVINYCNEAKYGF